MTQGRKAGAPGIRDRLRALPRLGDDAVVALWLGGTFVAETERFLRWERALGDGT